jgi:hypothetical protein
LASLLPLSILLQDALPRQSAAASVAGCCECCETRDATLNEIDLLPTLSAVEGKRKGLVAQQLRHAIDLVSEAMPKTAHSSDE